MFEPKPGTQYPSIGFLSFMRAAREAINSARLVRVPTHNVSRRLVAYLERYERLVSDLEAGKDTEQWGKAYERAVMQRNRIRDVAIPEAIALNDALAALEETMDVMDDDIMCLGYTLPRDEGG